MPLYITPVIHHEVEIGVRLGVGYLVGVLRLWSGISCISLKLLLLEFEKSGRLTAAEVQTILT